MSSIINYVAGGSTTEFQIPFTYISQAHVVVTLDGVATTSFTFLNSSTLQMNTAPTAGAKLQIQRTTPVGALVDFTDGSTLFESDLDLAHQQNRFIAEESRDIADVAKTTIDNNIADVNTVAGISGNVTTVAGISGNVTTVAGIAANVTTVAGDSADVQTVAGRTVEVGRLGTADAVADMNTLAAVSTEISQVSLAIGSVNTVAGNTTNINTVAGNTANVTTVAGISSDVTAVAGKASLITADFVSDLNTLAVTDVIADINLLATSDIVSDLNTLATSDIVSDLNTLAASDIVSDINLLATNDIVGDLNLLATSDFVSDLNTMATATNISNLNTVSGAVSNVNTVAGIDANVTTVAGISSAVTTVAADGTDIGVVSTNINNVNAVAGNSTNINAVVANATNINAVASDATDIGVVSGISANVSTVAANNTNVTTVAGISGNVTTVAGIAANVTAVAGDAADIGTVATDLAGSNTIGTVAGSISNVNSVGGAISNVSAVATNLASINDFADKYRIGATDPSTNNDEGDLFYNTTSDSLKVYTGTAWEQGVTAGSGFLPLTGGGLTGDLTFSGTQTVDGRDLSVDGAKLDGIEASADVTDTTNVVAALTAGSNITIAADGTITGAAPYTHPANHAISVITGLQTALDGKVDDSQVLTNVPSGALFTDTNTVYTHPTHPGDDASVDTGALSGATVISDLDFNITTDTLGHVTDANATVATRNLTLANLGYSGATNANYITNNNQLTNGAGYTTYTSNQATNTNNNVTFEAVTCNGPLYVMWNDASSNINMQDSDEGARVIHCNSNRIGFLSQAGSWGAYCQDDGSWVSDVYMTSPNFNTTSDATLKTNVETITTPLDKVKALRGVTFDWIESGNSEVGLIAQEVEAIVPDVVSTNKEGIKSVKYSNMVGLLIEAIKEQQAQIDALTAKLNG